MIVRLRGDSITCFKVSSPFLFQFQISAAQCIAAQFSRPRVSAIASYVGGFSCILNFGDVPPGIGLAAVEIGEPVNPRELTAGQRLSIPTRPVGILGKG